VFKYTPLTAVIQFKSGAKFIINSKYLREAVSFIRMCMPINYSMCLNSLLLASTRALSHARSMSMDAPMTRYSMLSEALFSKRCSKISR